MARGYLGSGPKKQDNSGLVESEQRKFPVGGMAFALVLGAQAEETGMVFPGKARKWRAKL